MISYNRVINSGSFFPVVMWLSSRLLILLAMLIIAPLLPTPSNGSAATFSWDIFSAWDSNFYEKIATSSYNTSSFELFAFFPLFPLFSRLVMNIGLPFKVAAVLVNNLAFLAALIILYLWIEQYYSKSVARWSTAVLAWCPYSIFGTVIYTEGLFLLCTTAALKAFYKKQHTLAAFWGALSTATRLPGIALMPAFLFISWKERRGIRAYIASLTVGLGIVLYSLYCQIKFGDALAFIHAQKAWRGDSSGFAWEGWGKMLMEITIGFTNLKYGYIQEIWHPLLFCLIIVSGYLLYHFRFQIGLVSFRYTFYFLWLVLWLLTGDELFKILLIFGGLYLIWLYRSQIPLVTVVYGLCSYALILNTGITASVERYAYGIVSLSVALGLFLSRHSRWGYMSVGFFAILIITFSIRFAQKLWIG